MWREILTYNSSILVLDFIVEENAIAYLSQFTYEQKSNSFVLNERKKQIIQSLQTNNGKNRISWLGFEVILDQHCGIFLPYFIVQDNKSCYLFCLDSNYEWLMRYKFSIPNDNIRLCDTSYFIGNGPTLIWTVKDEIFLYRAEYLEKRGDDILRVQIDLNFDLVLNVVGRILWWDGDSEQGMVVVKDCEGNVINSYLLSFDNKKRKANVTLNSQIIPLIYLRIATCTLVIPECLSSTENKYSYKVFITTTHGQLLEFSNGKCIKHMNIPLTSCQDIYMLENPEGDPILLCCQEDKICVVDWINSKIFKTHQVFPKVLIDDFIGLGTSQALLFNGLKYKSHETFDDFILTDFCMIDIKRSKELDKKENILSTLEESSIDNVMNALIRKVQLTEASVIQCKMDKSEKHSFLKKHCESLYNMLMDDKASAELQISGLTELVVGQAASHEELDVQYSKMVVRSKWQKITDSDWIIGVEVENVGPSAVSDISLCAVNKSRGILMSSSKMLRSEVQKGKMEKEVLPSGQRATAVTVTSPPNFSFRKHCTVSLILTWKHDENEYLSQFCGNMTLSIDDFMNSSSRKCQNLALYPLKTQVVLAVENCDISSVVEGLKSNTDACEHLPSQQKYHLRFPLATTCIDWTCTKNVKTLMLDIFTRDYNQLIMCLRLFHKQLPGNITWRPLGNQLTLNVAMNCIKNEISFCINELKTLLKAQTAVSPGNNIAVEESNEMSAKRRRITQNSKTVDLTTHQKIFSYFCDTNNAFLTLLFLQNTFE